MDLVRKMVSKKKRRFEWGSFDLDLSYITDRIIAMGFPSESIEGLYRNRMKDVQRFFNTLHTDRYKVFNLCSERKYQHDRFNNNVSEYPFDDHNPPNLDVIGIFCKDIEDWLELHPENVAAIHCKAGKGRTGTMIACWLLYNRHCQTGSESMRVFATKRTHNAKGITIPSQIRYVRYFEALLQHGKPIQKVPDVTKILSTIKMNALPNFNIGGGCTPYLGIVQQDKSVFYTKPLNLKKGTLQIEIYCGNILLTNDVKIQFFNKNSKGYMFSYCFHTAFVEGNSIHLRKLEIDKAHKDSKHFPSNFSIELHFIDKDTLDQNDIDQTIDLNNNNNNGVTNNVVQAAPTTHFATGLAKLYGNNDQLLLKDKEINIDNEQQEEKESTVVPRKQSNLLFICPKCKLSINATDVSVNDGNNNYHWKCLVCNNCQKSLTNDNDCLFQENGETLCITCGTTSGFFKSCHACNLIIKSSDFEEVGLLSFHRSCFFCTHCLLYLGEKDFTISDKKELKCSSCLHKPSIQQIKQEEIIKEVKEDEKEEEEIIKEEIEDDEEEEEEEEDDEEDEDEDISQNITIQLSIEQEDKDQQQQQQQDHCGGSELKCTKCKLEIGLRPLILDIGIWHRECFLCQDCETPLDQKRYFLRDGTILCSECDIQHILKKPVNEDDMMATSASMAGHSEIFCNGCKLVIEDEEMMSALGAKWHLQCLHCCSCQKPITGLFGEHQGLIYCKEHFEEIIGVRCEGCNQMIVGRYLKANGRQLHPHCFICFICTRVLQDGVFYEKAGEIICDRCRSIDIIKRRTQLQLQQSMIGNKRSLTASAVASSGSSGSDSSPHSNTLSRSLTTSQAHQTPSTANSMSMSSNHDCGQNSECDHIINQPSTISYLHNTRRSFRNSTRINLSDVKKNRTLHIYPSFHRQMTMNSNSNSKNSTTQISSSTFTSTSPKQFIVAYPSSKNHSKRREFLSNTGSLRNSICNNTSSIIIDSNDISIINNNNNNINNDQTTN